MLSPGEQIGRYSIVRRLAVGGMAEVYLARMRAPHGFVRSVVLKRIRPELARTGQIQRMFADEARVAAHLSHVNIAQVVDVGHEDGEPYLVMEYVEGRDLHALLAAAGGRGLPIDIAVAIALGVAAGLDHAHGRRDADGRPLDIVHRDVSPSNVMVGFDGNVKLLDFGVAKAQGARDVTRAGTVKGKLQYMSPEQALGLGVDRRSDLFSLGTVLYEMLVGARPFEDGALLVPPAERRDGVSAALDALVVAMLEDEPARRPASAEAVSSALDEIAREERLSCSPVALRRYLADRFGEPEAVSGGEPSLTTDGPETASVSVDAVTAVTRVDDPVDAAALAETVRAPAARKRGALLLALAAAAGLAVIPVLAADGETGAPAEVVVAAPPMATTPSPPPAPVSIEIPAPLPIPVAVPVETPAPRPSAKRRRSPPAQTAPAAATWDPDGPLLRSQQRRKRP